MRSMIAALTLCLAAASTLVGQTPATIDPGMSREQVVAKLGTPLSTRSFSGFTYLFYLNGCEKKCGMNDLVVLDSGKVVDAVFRSASRRYSGTSSSPRRISEAEARRGAGAGAPLKVTAPAKSQPPKKPTETAFH